MKQKLWCYFFTIIFPLVFINAQIPTAENFGVRCLNFMYKGYMVDIIIQSKPGEELINKPIFFFCQGSLPQPLLKYTKDGLYGIFPFDTRNIIKNFHLVIVGKPGVPLIANTNKLGANYTYVDSLQQFPIAYTTNNYLDYYVNRNIAVINFLNRQQWAKKNKLVVAGHSEGSTIAAKMAYKSNKITHLIYSSGNPMGRITSILQQARFYETDTIKNANQIINSWTETIANKEDLKATTGDSYKTTYSFSKPLFNNLLRLKIPVLVSYGTKDWCSAYNDLLQISCVTNNKYNFAFEAYINCEHNYFPVNKNLEPNYNIFNWDKVADNWLAWLAQNAE